MKFKLNWRWFAAGLGGLILVGGGYLGLTFYRLKQIETQLGSLSGDLVRGNSQPWSKWEAVFNQLNQDRWLFNLPLAQFKSMRPYINQIEYLKPMAHTFLGYDKPQHDVVLLQNNTELWPTGGYLGSYAEFYLDNGAMKDLKIESIDVPNGQIKGYVEAPAPIVTYTHNGGTPGWRLRESNWDPNFPQAMPTIEWFFKEGGIQPIDTMIATNLIPVIEILKLTGSIPLPDYHQTLTTDNFYQLTQQTVETGFFDGSTQKRDFLSYMGKQLIAAIIEKKDLNIQKVGKLLYQNLLTKQIMVATKDQAMSRWLKQQNWDGGLLPVRQTKNSQELDDYLMVNEANLGINKTNCCLDRRFSDSIQVASDSAISHRLELTFTNHNPATPHPPEQWGGGYRAYVRLYIPAGSVLIGLTDNGSGQPLKQELIDETIKDDKRIIGFPILVEGGMIGSYLIDYQVTHTQAPELIKNYRLTLQKQSGIESIPWEFNYLNGNIQEHHKIILDRDMSVSFLGLGPTKAGATGD